MRINLAKILFIIFGTGYNISSVSSIWIIVPSAGVKCGPNALLTNFNLADAVQPGCEKIARFEKSSFARFTPIRKYLAPKNFEGLQFTGSHPLFELELKTFHSNGRFQYPKYKAIFEWNKQQKTCIPRGVITIKKSGRQYKCIELHYPQKKYPDKFFDDSIGRNLRSTKLENIKPVYPEKSVFDLDIFPQPRGFFTSARSFGRDEPHEEFFDSLKRFYRNSPASSSKSKSTSDDQTVSFEIGPEYLSTQDSPVRPKMTLPSFRHRSGLLPQRSFSSFRSLFSSHKPSSPSDQDSALQLQRSKSTPMLNMISSHPSEKDHNPELESLAHSTSSFAPPGFESIRSDQQPTHFSKIPERLDPILKTPLNEKNMKS